MDAAVLTRPELRTGTSTTWTIDPTNSTIAFSIKHLKVATVRGRFTRFQGAVRLDPDQPEATIVEVEIDAASVDTREKKRDEHLRSADFFDVATYPAIIFRGTRVEPFSPARHDRWLVAGDLTIHGVTHPVKLTVEQTGENRDSWPGELLSFSAKTLISRKAFGIGLDSPLDGSGLLIADDVAIEIEIQAKKATVTGR
jgi:polyisoprenoid-binding protein YceI